VNVAVPSLTLVKRMKAPPALVWEAWTKPEVMMLWFGPHHTRAEKVDADLRLGGSFRITIREDTGAMHGVQGKYTEIEPPARLVFDWNWISTPERVSRVTVVLRPIPEGTEVTLTHDRFADAETATRHRRGWTESLERLVAMFGDGPQPDPKT
jgi:uncharacterized protein YndB with AHSA1/START domain